MKRLQSASHWGFKSGPSIRTASSGFSLVEIIVTIVIIGIVSAFAVSRFLSANTFNASIVRDQLISVIRSAQQNSLGRPDVSVAITPSSDSSSVTISSNDDGGTVSSYETSLRNVSLSGDINTTASCGSTPGGQSISNASPMTINFGKLGDLAVSGVSGNTGAVTSALRICVNNNPTDSVCVSPSGFAYAGDCDV
ncbi:MAG: prepilin-type N-terminal cleavage/methylation domain-containing protein [Pseudohongiellaceae bacterium]